MDWWPKPLRQDDELPRVKKQNRELKRELAERGAEVAALEQQVTQLRALLEESEHKGKMLESELAVTKHAAAVAATFMHGFESTMDAWIARMRDFGQGGESSPPIIG